MPILHSYFQNSAFNWLVDRVDRLDGRAKFCAQNSLRYLKWANEAYAISPLVSNFNASHATEEAVVSFISSMLSVSDVDGVKRIKIREHKTKALVSILAQRFINSLGANSLRFAVSPNHDNLIFEIGLLDTQPIRGEYHLSNLSLHDEGEEVADSQFLIGNSPKIDDIFEEMDKVAKARNALLYANERGVPTGFVDPDEALVRDAELTLGLIWAAIDVQLDPEGNSEFLRRIALQILELQREGRNRHREATK